MLLGVLTAGETICNSPCVIVLLPPPRPPCNIPLLVGLRSIFSLVRLSCRLVRREHILPLEVLFYRLLADVGRHC